MSMSMNMNNIYKEIASENATTVEEVKDEIRNALEMGFQCPDPDVQDFWRQIPCDGEKPSLDELILFIVASLRTDN